MGRGNFFRVSLNKYKWSNFNAQNFLVIYVSNCLGFLISILVFFSRLLLPSEEREGRYKSAGFVLRYGLRHCFRQFFRRPPTVFPQYLLDRRRIGEYSHVTAPYLEDTAVYIVSLFAAQVDNQGSNILRLVHFEFRDSLAFIPDRSPLQAAIGLMALQVP
jgi:hypothetical protein